MCLLNSLHCKFTFTIFLFKYIYLDSKTLSEQHAKTHTVTGSMIYCAGLIDGDTHVAGVALGTLLHACLRYRCSPLNLPKPPYRFLRVSLHTQHTETSNVLNKKITNGQGNTHCGNPDRRRLGFPKETLQTVRSPPTASLRLRCLPRLVCARSLRGLSRLPPPGDAWFDPPSWIRVATHPHP